MRVLANYTHCVNDMLISNGRGYSRNAIPYFVFNSELFDIYVARVDIFADSKNERFNRIQIYRRSGRVNDVGYETR